MKSIKFFLLLFLVGLFTTDSNSQTKKTEYVIQVATYASVKAFDKHYAALQPLEDHGMVVQTQADKKVYAYLLDTYGNFTSKAKAKQKLKSIQKLSGFKSAYVKGVQSDYSREKTLAEYSASKKPKVVAVNIPKQLPSEFTAKGGRIATTKYRIQLGCFGEMKSTKELASAYNLSNYEQANIKKFMTHDFTNVDGDVCRRYYFGNFATKADANKRKAAMEKASGGILKVVKK